MIVVHPHDVVGFQQHRQLLVEDTSDFFVPVSVDLLI